MVELIDKYLEYKAPIWSTNTLKSERARLNSLAPIMSRPPRDIYLVLKEAGKKPYTIKKYLMRLSEFLSWARPNEANEVKDFMQANKWLFKHAYQTKQIGKSYDEVKSDIETICQPDVKAHALFLLRSGLRIHESYRVQTDDSGQPFVVGKGNKRRQVYAQPPKKLTSEWRLRTGLKSIGLTPHDLRRVFATKLLRSGLAIHDVAAVMGHTGIHTIMRYLQTSQHDSLRAQITNVLD